MINRPSFPSGIRFFANGARKAAIFVVGGAVLLVGIAMIVLPGPAVVVIPIGLGILATEFKIARTLLKLFMEKAAQVGRHVFGKRNVSGGRHITIRKK